MRRIVNITAWTMIWSGAIILGYVGYQLYGTDLVNQRAQVQAQAALPDILESRAEDVAVQAPPTTIAESEPDVPSLLTEPPVGEGEAFAAIRIPSIGVDQVLYEGVDRDTLEQGPGHIPWTSFPGQPGNAVLSGHRTTNGRPFYDLDLLEPGDVIEVESAVGVSTYIVRESTIVTPFDVWVAEQREGAWLTLTTCHPKYSARERLIVFAEMTAGPNLDYIELAA
jgi:sortase A